MGVGTKDPKWTMDAAEKAKATRYGAAATHDGKLDNDIEKNRKELAEWRDAYTIAQAQREQARNKNNEEAFTVAELSSGGCLDTIAAIRAGFGCKWSSEIDQAQARMYEELTGGECLGDTFGRKVEKAERVHYMKSGQPCINWSRSGNGEGEDGETGWMFVEQTRVILKKRPQAFRLEISDFAMNIDDGAGVKKVVAALESRYVIRQRIIQVWRHGDPSNRKRLFIVGCDKELGQAAYEFRWPKPSFDENTVPIARMIAVEDADVPEEYWRYDEVVENVHWEWADRKDRIQVIARQGVGMGPAKMPNTIRSWDGLLNGPTRLGGGGRGPELAWKSGEKIKRTRMTVPAEYQAAASLPHDYIEWCQKHARGNTDEFILRCINNGVPVRTSVAIDTAVMAVLTMAKSRREHPTIKHAHETWTWKAIRHMLFDTGANGSINFRDVEQWLQGACKSLTRVTVANKGSMEVGMDGNLPMCVLNTAGYEGIDYTQNLAIETTTAESALELFAFDPLYRDGWGLHCRPRDEMNGRSEIYRPARKDQKRVSIPLRYDWTSERGGFWVDYMVITDPQPEHFKLLAAHHLDMIHLNELAKEEAKRFDQETTRTMVADLKRDTDVTEVLVGQHDADRQLRGVKLGLKTDIQKMSCKDFHKFYGHLGCQGDCEVCKMVKGASRRIRKKVDPHKENRVAYKFHLDTITWSDRSSQGNKYASALRCEGSDMFVAFAHFTRDDIVDIIGRWVEVLRADPAYHDCGYKIAAVLCLDNAGEWALKCNKFKTMCENMGIETIYSCPDRKESAANAEVSMGILEVTTKALLMQNNLLAYWWEQCMASAVFLLNRFPTTTLAATNSIDGDRPRPLELFSRFHYSRRQIDRELSYYLAPGTPALVQTKEKGSSLNPKTRWGIATAMYREQVIFMCPHTLAEFRSKSFAAFRLKDGLNYFQFLNLPEVQTARGRVAVHTDFREKVTVQLPEYNKNPKRQAVRPITEVVLCGDSALNPPMVTVTEQPAGELGGTVLVTGAAGEQLELGSEISQSGCARTADETGRKKTSSEKTGGNSESDRMYIDCRNSESVKALFDEADARSVLNRRRMCSGEESLTRICKLMGLEFEQHRMYYEWLTSTQGLAENVLNYNTREKLRAGLILPYPSGEEWRQIKARGSRKQRRANMMDFNSDEDAVEATELWIEEQISEQSDHVRKGGAFCFNITKSREIIACNIETKRPEKDLQAAKKKRTKAVQAGQTAPPKNVKEALYGEDADTWTKSLGNEFWGLVEMGVMELGYTKEMLLKEGIDTNKTPAVPCGTYFEHKFNSEGELAKHKARVAIQGHKGNMQKGIHFSETFSATPRENTWKIMCALTVLMNLTRRAFDITKAYCWADLPPGELIALRYPDGFKKYHPETGEELFMILRKNLYGHPSAGRTFSKARNKEILRRFNQDGWKCERTRSDPCLFVLTRKIDGETRYGWLLAHVDDCDIVCEGDEMGDKIVAVCADIWTITTVNPEFMLGIRRRTKYSADGKVESCECDMIAFIEGMHEAFKDHMPDKMVNDPAPPKMYLSKEDKVDPGESERVIKAGYQAAVGMLLWAVRHCHPIGKTAVSMMCRVMAKPSWKAFNAAMQLIAWLYQNRTEGIKFSSRGNKIPIGFVDASNKPDILDDGLAQYGYVITWMGGPVGECSKKLTQVGLSSAHVEYMAMYYAHQYLAWFRNLIREMDLEHIIQAPTMMFADNKAANTLSKEDVVTHGNQYVGLSYHYNKEMQEKGESLVHYIITDDNISDLMTKVVEISVRKKLQGPLSGYDTRLIRRLEQDVINIQENLTEQN